jgi:short-subunit dehydrogenase
MHNAAVELAHPVDTLEPEQIAAAVNVNLTSAIVLASVLGEAMLAGGRGHVALMASMAGLFGSPGPVYTSTKCGLRGLALSLVQDWKPRGVGVSIIYPGAVKAVGMVARGLGSIERQPAESMIRPVTAERVATHTADAIEADRLETIVADPTLRVAARIGGLMPSSIAKALHKMPATTAVRNALIVGSELQTPRNQRS